MSLFRRETRTFSGFMDPNRIPTNGEIGSGQSQFVTGHAAMRNGAVWACTRIVADVISTLPLDLIVNGEPADALPTKLQVPSAYASSLQWRYQATLSLLLRGNAYGLISATDRLGYPSQIDLLAPEHVDRVRKDASGRKVFEIQGKTLSTEQVWHLPGPQLPGDLEGMSPILYAARTISLGLDAERFGSDYFRNGIHPSAIAETDQAVTAEQADIVKKRIKAAQRNRDVVVLGAGLKLTPWTISPEESQFIETQRLNAVAIAQIFGVPPEMIGAAAPGGTVTYANREQRAQDFLNSAINPWLARFEESLSAWFPQDLLLWKKPSYLLAHKKSVFWKQSPPGLSC